MLSIISLLFLFLAVICNASASLLFKVSAETKNDLTYVFLFLGLIVGAANAYFYMLTLKEGMQLNIAYPLFSALSIVLISIASSIFFKEKITLNWITGTIILLIGIIFISRK
jgi:multidrug transporter EmrE-like cation transporter